MTDKEFIQSWLKFKNECVENKIFEVMEIIRLFEIWLNQS